MINIIDGILLDLSRTCSGSQIKGNPCMETTLHEEVSLTLNKLRRSGIYDELYASNIELEAYCDDSYFVVEMAQFSKRITRKLDFRYMRYSRLTLYALVCQEIGRMKAELLRFDFYS